MGGRLTDLGSSWPKSSPKLAEKKYQDKIDLRLNLGWLEMKLLKVHFAAEAEENWIVKCTKCIIIPMLTKR